MKVCLYLQASDLIKSPKAFLERLNNIVIKDEKHDLFKKQPVAKVLARIKKAGVDGLELIFSNSISDREITQTKELSKEYSLPILNIHQSNDNSFSISILEIKKLCEIAKSFSSEVVTLHMDSLGKHLFDSNFVAKLKNLEKKYDLKFGIENMPKSPFNFWMTYAYRSSEFLSILEKNQLFITFDTTHLSQVKGDIYDFYLKNKDKIINIHLSDFKKSFLNQYLLLANGTHLPLGEGDLLMEKFLKTLKKEKYCGHITMEVNGNLEDLCKSARLIKKYID